MPYKIEVRPLAAFETIEAYDWYESQKDGSGLTFLDELDNFYNCLLLNPAAYSYFDKPVRQGHINKFPYTVVYEVFETVVVIYSVFMEKQDPSRKRTL